MVGLRGNPQEPTQTGEPNTKRTATTVAEPFRATRDPRARRLFTKRENSPHAEVFFREITTGWPDFTPLRLIRTWPDFTPLLTEHNDGKNGCLIHLLVSSVVVEAKIFDRLITSMTSQHEAVYFMVCSNPNRESVCRCHR